MPCPTLRRPALVFDSWRILDEEAVRRGRRPLRGDRLRPGAAAVSGALILGGAGFIGYHLARRLAADGAR